MGSGPTILRLARGGTSALDLDTESGRPLARPAPASRRNP